MKKVNQVAKLSKDRRQFLKKLLRGAIFTTAAIYTVTLKSYAAPNPLSMSADIGSGAKQL